MTKKMIKISIDHSNLDFPLDTIGIDMGQSIIIKNRRIYPLCKRIKK